MKHHFLSLGALLTALLASSHLLAQSGVTKPSLGTQYVYLGANTTTVVAPQFLYPGTGLLTQGGITTNTVYGVTEQFTNGQIAYLSFTNDSAIGGTFSVTSITPTNFNYSLKLAGNPPTNSYGVPLTNNEYQYSSNQPTTFFVLVTAGNLKGNFYTVLSNTTNSLTIDPEGMRMGSKDILAVNLLPYWSLSSLFPPSQAWISFIPTTNAGSVMTQIVISPPTTTGTQQPQQVGTSYYFSAAVTNWVVATNPSLLAGDTVIAPGAYVYVQNTGSNSYPLNVFISGTVLTNQFNFYFPSSRTSNVTSYLSLPRNTTYPISQIGFTDANFVQSTGTNINQRNDQLILANSNGGIGDVYYKYKNQWYSTDNDIPTNPVFPAGSAFGLMKRASTKGTATLINKSNLK